MNTDKLTKLLQTKEMYFYDDFLELVVKTIPKKGKTMDYFVKYKNEKEYKTDSKNTNVFETVYLYRKTINKKHYDEY